MTLAGNLSSAMLIRWLLIILALATLGYGGLRAVQLAGEITTGLMALGWATYGVGDDGDVTQTNLSAALAASLNANKTDQDLDQTQGGRSGGQERFAEGLVVGLGCDQAEILGDGAGEQQGRLGDDGDGVGALFAGHLGGGDAV